MINYGFIAIIHTHTVKPKPIVQKFVLFHKEKRIKRVRTERVFHLKRTFSHGNASAIEEEQRKVKKKIRELGFDRAVPSYILEEIKIEIKIKF